MNSSLHTTHLTESPTALFDFETTATAHGWVALRPFEWDATAQALRRTQQLSSGQVVRLTMTADDSSEAEVHITIDSAAPLSATEEDEARRAVRRMLRLEEDFSDFYRLYQQYSDWSLQLKPGEGRLLRCPTLFEDIIYTLCTTNINWRGTIRMVDRLVAALGESVPGQAEWRAFPTAEAIIEAGADFLKRETGLGYRSGYVWELAAAVTEGRLDLGAFERPDYPTATLRRDLRQLKGVGDYAAATILMLLGRYEHLAIDSELRLFVTKKYFEGETPTEAQIRELYAPWGQWQYLAYWFDTPAP